jgi:hypothetical protein
VKDIVDTLSGATKHLPSRDQILNALDTRRSPVGDLAPMLGVLAVGVMLGAALAILFAPTPGSEIRQAIGERVRRSRESLTGSNEPSPDYSGTASHATT